MDEDRSSGLANDKISVFMRCFVSANCGIDVFSWWKGDQARYSTLAKTACDAVVIRASSLVAESCIQGAGNLILDHRTSMSD